MSVPITSQTLFIVDASAILYRSYYGLKPLSTSHGVPTQAIYGFWRAIKKITDDYKPLHLAIVWDAKGGSFRNELFSEYKAGRQAPPSDLGQQRDGIQKIAEAMGVCQLTQLGYEADDIIASLVAQAQYDHAVIVTPDKDLAQLVSDRVTVFDPFKNIFVTEDVFIKTQGFNPHKTIFYHSLLGDSSDNIPGVAGVGKKTALELVQQFGSLKEMYENLEKVEKVSLRKKLEAEKENAFLSETLFTLKPPLLTIKENEFAYSPDNWVKAESLFREYEFSSLVPAAHRAATAIAEPQLPEHDSWECIIVRSLDEVQKIADEMTAINGDVWVGVDTETDSSAAVSAMLVGLSISYTTTQSYYIPIAHKEVSSFTFAHVKKILEPVLVRQNIKVAMHNAKFDLLVFAAAGWQNFPLAFDTIIAAHLLPLPIQKLGLKALSLGLLNERMLSFSEVVVPPYKTFADVPVDDASRYAAHDAIQTLKLAQKFDNDFKKYPTLQKLFYELEVPFMKVLYGMERRGIGLNKAHLEAVRQKVLHAIAQVEQKLEAAIEAAGVMVIPGTINWGSPRQMEILLFDQLGLMPLKKSPTGKRSTDYEVLEALAKIHPVPALLVEHRELMKLNSTYCEPLPEAVNPVTGRIHTSYNQTAVVTGRLSSVEPNLQNVPTSGTYGLEIREAFEPRPGALFISADYSQIELRIVAHLTQDPVLLDAFFNDRDVHAQTAAQLFDVAIDAVTHDQRQLGKRINFSILYGLTPYGLAQDLGIGMGEAKGYIEKFFQKYAKVKEWMDAIVEIGKAQGYVETFFGRRRYLPELQEKNKILFESARRAAMNTPVQGTAAEILKVAMVRLDEAFKAFGGRAALLLQIHDEVLIEVDAEIAEKVSEVTQKIMETVVPWEVPLKVTIRSGRNWGEVTK